MMMMMVIERKRRVWLLFNWLYETGFGSNKPNGGKNIVREEDKRTRQKQTKLLFPHFL